MRWCLFWSAADGRLWVYSGDEGLFVWEPGREGKYSLYTFVGTGDPKEKLMPTIFYDFLPDSIKKTVKRPTPAGS